MALVKAILFAIDLAWSLVLEVIMLRAEREAGDVFDLVLTGNQNDVFPIIASAGLTFENQHHGFGCPSSADGCAKPEGDGGERDQQGQP